MSDGRKELGSYDEAEYQEIGDRAVGWIIAENLGGVGIVQAWKAQWLRGVR